MLSKVRYIKNFCPKLKLVKPKNYQMIVKGIESSFGVLISFSQDSSLMAIQIYAKHEDELARPFVNFMKMIYSEAEGAL